MSILLALVASVVWSWSDFLGGTLCRRRSAAVVLFGAHLAALLILLPISLLMGLVLSGELLTLGLAAGVITALAASCLFRALALGPMGVVLAINGTSATIPAVAGLATGERPGLGALAGITLACAGVVLAAAAPSARGTRMPKVAVVLAAVAACVTGLLLMVLARGSEVSVLTMVVLQRVGLVFAFGCYVWQRERSTVASLRRTEIAAMSAVGVGDMLAVAAYALATTRGFVSVAAVLASLYPAGTALLARWLLDERLSKHQLLGIAATLAGVALVTTTSSADG